MEEPRAAVRHNLPAEGTAFMGRDAQVGEVGRLVGTSRLVTLVGAGGVGKTRLALRIAAAVARDFPDGVWLAQLAGLRDADLVATEVAEAVGVGAEPGRTVDDTLRAALAARRILLVLDNCEHLVAACASLVAALLAHAPALRVLATSREPLRVEGEVIWRVPSLAVPADRAEDPLEIGDAASVQLLIDRARAREPAFGLTPANAAAVADVCRRLDGVPLAIELAAARISALSVEQIATRLDGALRLLGGGARTVPRQQTLLATLDWSHALLAEPERAVFRRLAVFPAWFGLAAAEAVCGAPAYPDRLDPSDVLSLVAALVDKSLVVATVSGIEARYRLLEVVRQYARERLAAAGEEAAARSAHAAAVLTAAEDLDRTAQRGSRAAGLDAAEAEVDDARAALAWFAEQRDGDRGLRLACAIIWPWMAAGRVPEARRWFEQLLRLDALPVSRMRGLMLAAGLAMLDEEADAATELGHRAIALEPELRGPDREWAWCAAEAKLIVAVAAANRGEHNEARVLADDGLAGLRRAGHELALGRGLMGAGVVARLTGDAAAAVALDEEGAATLRRHDDPYYLAHSLSNLGLALMALGHHDRAERQFRESLTLRQTIGDRPGAARSLRDLGHAAAARGRVSAARARYGEALALARAVGDRLTAADAEAALARLGAQPEAGAGAGLTPREREVAALVARGYSNRRIADELVVAAGTAGLHVKHILAKLGFRSRAQIAAWVASQER